MDDLFFFDDVVNAIQGEKPQKKRSRRRLVKSASMSQGIESSQSVGEGSWVANVEAIQPLSIIPAVLALQASRIFKEPIQVPSGDGSDVED